VNDRLAKLKPGPLDIHTHVLPPSLLARLEAGERSGLTIEAAPDGKRLNLAGKRSQAPILAGLYSMEIRERKMAEHGVSAQLLSPWIGLVPNHLGEADAVWLAEKLNEGIAGIADAAPDRFVGLGSVPLHWPERAAEMLRWAMGELGLFGVEINTTLGPERFLDDPTLDAFWAEAEKRGALIFIHPSLGGSGKQYERYYLNNLVHNPLETTVAAAHLIFGGVMERFPRLRILLAHGGGFLPYNLGRLRRGRLVRKETKVSMQGSVEESFGRFLFDTVTHSASALRFLVEQVGAENVIAGSDYPFDMADDDFVRTVGEAGIDEPAAAALLRGNAERLFGEAGPSRFR
jgi:aminocarboxymuconate-semialdehyde decarboxylase